MSCALAGAAGGIQALFVSYVTAGSTFNITVPLTVVLMSVLGGTRHWAGPAHRCDGDHLLLYASTAADQAVIGKARSAARCWSLAILFMPDGILGCCASGARRARRQSHRRRSPAVAMPRRAMRRALATQSPSARGAVASRPRRCR